MGRFLLRLWRLLIHPISLIVVVQSAWTLALVFWILFFVRRYHQLTELAGSRDLPIEEVISWAPLVVGIVLLGLIFAGTLALILWLMRQFLINRQMRNFLSFVSHELRTPITSISLMLETLRDNPLDAGQRSEFIDNMLQDTDRLSRQIVLILDASRLEHHSLPLRTTALELDRLVSRYAESRGSSPAAAAHELKLGENMPCVIHGDADLLNTVLDNLVNNAERYSPPGTPITLSVSEDGKWALLQVRDQGMGVDRAERNKIFKPFYRGASAHGVMRQGSGLGLYLVKGIVSMHRGTVDVISPGPGMGSTFRVRLPLLKAERSDAR